MTASMIVRTAVPELDALTNLGHAFHYSNNIPTVAAIQNAVAVVSDKARSRGATEEEIYDSYQDGVRGRTYFNADRDEQIVIAHLARALVYLDDTHLGTTLAVTNAIRHAVTADSAVIADPAAA